MAQAVFDPTTIGQGNLLELCPLVSGAVVSKPLLHTPQVKVIVFAMDAGQRISQHRAPFVATVQVLRGELQFGVGGQTRQLCAHDWLVMPPDEPHDLEAAEPCWFMLTLLQGQK